MIQQTTLRLVGFLGFVKATVIGGVFVLAPIVVLAVIIGKAVSLAHETLHPLMAHLPIQNVGGISLALLLGIAILIGICFLAGLLANTALATWIVKWVELAILSNLPGYSLMKSMGEGLAGVSRNDGHRAVLVHFEETSQFGFLMDVTTDGRGVIFIPAVPSPWSGDLHIVKPENYEPLEVPMQSVVERLQRLGLGAGALLKAPAVPLTSESR